MNQINNSILFTSLATGTTIFGRLNVANLPLIQRYNTGTNSFSPDFEVLAENAKPIVYPFLTDTRTGEILVPTTSTLVWKYNGVTLTFGSDGLSTNSGMDGCFKSLTYSATIASKTYNLPALRVMKNLVPISNYDNDLISLSGSVERSGQQIPFAELNKEVVIEESTGSQFDAVITNTKGSQIVSETDTVTETVNLYKNGVLVTDYSAYTFQWVKVTATGEVTMSSTSRTATITAADVDSKLRLRCDVKENGSVIATGWDEITDNSDPYDLLLPITGIAGTQFTEDNQTAVVTPKVVKRSTQAAVTGYTFTFTTKNNAGTDFTLTGKSSSSFTGTSASISKADVDRANRGLAVYVQASTT